MVVEFELFGGTKPEIYGYVKTDSIVKSSTMANYTASLDVTKVGDLGGATLSKTEGIYVGEDLTLTVQAVDGYNPIVKFNNETIKPEEDGTYKVKAVFENSVTVEYESASVVYEYSELEKFDFQSKLTGYKPYNAEQMNAFIKGSTTLAGGSESTNYVGHSIEGAATSPLIGANGGSGENVWTDYNALKLGSGSKNSKITLTFKDECKIGKIVVKASGWTGKTCKLAINGTEAQQMTTSITKATIEDGTAYQEYVFTFTPSNAIVLETTLCVMISEMTVVNATATEA